MRVLALDPGDMDTELHAIALPDVDPASLKRPETAARELADVIAAALPNGELCGVRRGSDPRERTMTPESRAIQRPSDARLLGINAAGQMRQILRADLVTLLHSGDLVIANDAGILPASLHGSHIASGGAIEVRLAGWPSGVLNDPRRFHAIVFGAGDYRQRTEDRPPPPVLQPGDRLALGPLSARIEALAARPPTICDPLFRRDTRRDLG